MGDNSFTHELDDRPIKKFKISFNTNYEEEMNKLDEVFSSSLKKPSSETGLLSKSIQQMKLELAAEETKKRVIKTIFY
jgi:hypothetical protein